MNIQIVSYLTLYNFMKGLEESIMGAVTMSVFRLAIKHTVKTDTLDEMIGDMFGIG